MPPHNGGMKSKSRFTSQPQGLALLQAGPIDPRLPPRMAVLAAQLTPDAEGWCQLLPAGFFNARDGRPFDVEGGQWYLDEQTAGCLISKARQLGQDLLVDYEHQTLKSDQNGQPAPAAGWFNGTEMMWREDSGLFIKPRWTERAKQMIASGEYRFLSAVFPYDASGRPLEIRMAALVNDPGVVGMQALAALAAHLFTQPTSTEENHPMNDLLAKLLAKIGIQVAAGTEPTEAQGTAALSAVDALLAGTTKTTELEQQVAALKATQPANEVDLAQYVPKVTYDAAIQELAVLKAGSAEQGITDVITTAQREGRILAGEVDYLSQFGKQQGLVALKSMLATRAPIAALAAQQTDGKKPEGKKEELTSEELAVLKATGLSREAFIQAKGGDQ